MEPLVVIPRGGQKRPGGPWPAARLYTGGYFRQALLAARALAPDHRIRILSGRHGLLDLDAPVESYEQRIDAPGAVTVARVREQAERAGLLDSDVIALCGEVYATIVKGVWPSATTPLAACRGIGLQMAELKRIREAPGRLF